MQRFVLRNRISGQFYRQDSDDQPFVIDATLFDYKFAAMEISKDLLGYQVCEAHVSVNDVRPIPVIDAVSIRYIAVNTLVKENSRQVYLSNDRNAFGCWHWTEDIFNATLFRDKFDINLPDETLKSPHFRIIEVEVSITDQFNTLETLHAS
jgi:hypothetical protein